MLIYFLLYCPHESFTSVLLHVMKMSVNPKGSYLLPHPHHWQWCHNSVGLRSVHAYYYNEDNCQRSRESSVWPCPPSWSPWLWKEQRKLCVTDVWITENFSILLSPTPRMLVKVMPHLFRFSHHIKFCSRVVKMRCAALWGEISPSPIMFKKCSSVDVLAVTKL